MALCLAEKMVSDEKEAAKAGVQSDAGQSDRDAQTNFSVWRLDDNNNAFLVRDGLTRDEALLLVRDYEARGHKQAYWVSQG